MFFFSSASPTSSLTPYLFNLMFFSFSISKKRKTQQKTKAETKRKSYKAQNIKQAKDL